MLIFTNIHDETLINKLNSVGINVDYGKNYFTDNLDFSKYDIFLLSPNDLAYITATLTLTDNPIYIMGHFPYPSERLICVYDVDQFIRSLLPPQEKDIRPFLLALAATLAYQIKPDKNGIYTVPHDLVENFTKLHSLNITASEDAILFTFLDKGKSK
jgi:hypothetical protein